MSGEGLINFLVKALEGPWNLIQWGREEFFVFDDHTRVAREEPTTITRSPTGCVNEIPSPSSSFVAD